MSAGTTTAVATSTSRASPSPTGRMRSAARVAPEASGSSACSATSPSPAHHHAAAVREDTPRLEPPARPGRPSLRLIRLRGEEREREPRLPPRPDARAPARRRAPRACGSRTRTDGDTSTAPAARSSSSVGHGDPTLVEAMSDAGVADAVRPRDDVHDGRARGLRRGRRDGAAARRRADLPGLRRERGGRDGDEARARLPPRARRRRAHARDRTRGARTTATRSARSTSAARPRSGGRTRRGSGGSRTSSPVRVPLPGTRRTRRGAARGTPRSSTARSSTRARRHVAAFIAEPVGGATLAAAVPSDDYWPAVVEVCRRHGVLVIADEVMTGFGRTGRWFGSDHWGVRPDVLTAGKGSTSGYWPFGFAACSGEVFETVKPGGFVHGFTWSHNGVGAAVAHATLRRLRDGDLVDASARQGERLLKDLTTALGDAPAVGDVRGIGSMVGIELVARPRAQDPVPARGPGDRAGPRRGARPGAAPVLEHRARRGRRRPADARARRSRSPTPRSRSLVERTADAIADVTTRVTGRAALVRCPEARIYDHGPEHPLRPQRVLLTWDLIEACGMLDGADVDDARMPVRPTDEEIGARPLARVHRRDAARRARRGR